MIEKKSTKTIAVVTTQTRIRINLITKTKAAIACLLLKAVFSYLKQIEITKKVKTNSTTHAKFAIGTITYFQNVSLL